MNHNTKRKIINCYLLNVLTYDSERSLCNVWGRALGTLFSALGFHFSLFGGSICRSVCTWGFTFLCWEGRRLVLWFTLICDKSPLRFQPLFLILCLNRLSWSCRLYNVVDPLRSLALNHPISFGPSIVHCLVWMAFCIPEICPWLPFSSWFLCFGFCLSILALATNVPLFFESSIACLSVYMLLPMSPSCTTSLGWYK